MGKFKQLDIERMNEMGHTISYYNRFPFRVFSEDTTQEKTPKQVIFNPPCTIVLWNDGSKTIVRCFNEEFDPEKGFSMAIAKKILGRMEFERLLKVGTDSLTNNMKKNIKLLKE